MSEEKILTAIAIISSLVLMGIAACHINEYFQIVVGRRRERARLQATEAEMPDKPINFTCVMCADGTSGSYFGEPTFRNKRWQVSSNITEQLDEIRAKNISRWIWTAEVQDKNSSN